MERIPPTCYGCKHLKFGSVMFDELEEYTVCTHPKAKDLDCYPEIELVHIDEEYRHENCPIIAKRRIS